MSMTQSTAGAGGGEQTTPIGQRIGSPHFVEATRNRIIEAIGAACAGDDIHVDGHGVVSMTFDRWARLKPAVDAQLEQTLTIAADAVLKLAALASAPPAGQGNGVPAGWKLVPVEPTEDMLAAYWRQTGESHEMRSRTEASARYRYSAMLASAPPAPTPEAWSDLAKLSAEAVQGEWSIAQREDAATVEIDAAGSSGKPWPDCNVRWSALASFIVKMEDDAHCCGMRNAEFIVALVNAYRSGRLVEASVPPPPGEDLAGQGEPVAWAYEERGFDFKWHPIVSMSDPGELPWVRDIRPLYAAPTSTRPADREEIAKLIRPGAFEELSPDPYGPSVELLEMGRAPGRAEALAKADAILAYLALRDAPRNGGDEETLETIAEWCEQTFGSIEPARIVSRAAEEMDELRAEPTRVEEAADVVIVLSRYPGLWGEIQRKMKINRARKWRLMGDGTGYHIKDTPPSSNAGDGTQDTQGGGR